MLLKIMYSPNRNDFRVAWQFALSTFLETATVIVRVSLDPLF